MSESYLNKAQNRTTWEEKCTLYQQYVDYRKSRKISFHIINCIQLSVDFLKGIEFFWLQRMR